MFVQSLAEDLINLADVFTTLFGDSIDARVYNRISHFQLEDLKILN